MSQKWLPFPETQAQHVPLIGSKVIGDWAFYGSVWSEKRSLDPRSDAKSNETASGPGGLNARWSEKAPLYSREIIQVDEQSWFLTVLLSINQGYPVYKLMSVQHSLTTLSLVSVTHY